MEGYFDTIHKITTYGCHSKTDTLFSRCQELYRDDPTKQCILDECHTKAGRAHCFVTNWFTEQEYTE